MRRTLVVAPAWIGDMVMAHCLVQRLHARNPAEEIHLLAPPATAPIARRMAEVAQVHVLDIPHGVFGLRTRFRIGRELSQLGFAQSYVLPNSWKSALVPWFARIPRRTGWLGEARYGLLNDTAALPTDRLPLMIERFMALQNIAEKLDRPYPQPCLTTSIEQQQRLLGRHGLLSEPGALALCPGAEFGQAKRWPAGHFAEVARQAIDAGLQVWLLGGPADRPVCEEIFAAVLGREALLKQEQENKRERAAPLVNLAGATSLEDAIDLLAAAVAVVCNDSGLMHMASAVDTPAIALYGSTSPGFTPPLHSGAHALTLVDLDGGANRLDCQPCFQRTCQFGHGDCLARLPPQEVVTRLRAMGVLGVLRVAPQ